MTFRRNNATMLFLGLLALSLLVGRPAFSWRDADGALCRTCAFDLVASAADCCDTHGVHPTAEECRDCCLLSDDAPSARDGQKFAGVSTLPPASAIRETPMAAAEPLPFPRLPIVFSPCSAPHSPPGLRAPPFPV